MKEATLAPDLLKTKQHFHILDGMRGIAALAVVVFHFMEWVYPPADNFIGHGFLAVDFFFCLSGFVIGYAYDNRIGKIGLKEFFKSRLIRLHPLVILGSVLGLLALFLDPFSTGVAADTRTIIIVFVASLFMIPMPLMEERAFNNFPLNAPSWSLFWEYIINIFYAVFLCRLSKKMLAIFAIAAAILLFYVSYNAGNLLGGWSKDNFFEGGARVAYSFSAGLLIYRSKWIIKNSFGFPILAVLLSLAFLMPAGKWDWWSEYLVVLLYFPLLVSLGAGSAVSGFWEKFCRLAGNLSYPLYMTHYCALWIFGSWLTAENPKTPEITVVIIGGTIVLVLFAYLMMKVYDVPVRKWLSRKR